MFSIGKTVMPIIEADNIGVMFKLKHERRQTLKKSVLNLFKKKPSVENFWALKNASFIVNEGESLGVIGSNGSGKTTLLRVIGGIFKPDEGSIRIKGRVSSLLSIGLGFQPELTGLENIYLNSAVLGMTKKQTDAIVDDVIRFSELNDFISLPVKTYSSGMHARLGFSIAVHIEQNIILIDEVLGVGDMYFREKCEKKMMQFRQQGKTIVLVSHNIEAIKSFCSRAILLDKGAVKAQGKPEKVVEQYMNS
jgi:ABC-2 type transport system ATP-binding protein